MAKLLPCPMGAQCVSATVLLALLAFPLALAQPEDWIPGTCIPGSGPRCGAPQTVQGRILTEAAGDVSNGGRREGRMLATVNDGDTNIPFSTPQAFWRLGNTQLTLLGTGTAFKYGVKVYSVGVYIDLANFDAAQYQGRSVDSLKQDQAFYDAITNSNADKVFVMALARDVSKSTMSGAFQNGIGGDIQPVADQYNQDTFKTNTGIVMSLQGMQRVLISYIPDVTQGYDTQNGNGDAIDSGDLCTRIGNFYLGTSPRTQALKDSIATRVSAGL